MHRFSNKVLLGMISILMLALISQSHSFTSMQGHSNLFVSGTDSESGTLAHPSYMYLELLKTVDWEGNSTYTVKEHNVWFKNNLDQPTELTLQESEDNPAPSPIQLFENYGLSPNTALDLEVDDLEEFEEGEFNFHLTANWPERSFQSTITVEVIIETVVLEREYEDAEEIIDHPAYLYLELLETVDKEGVSTFEVKDHNLSLHNKLEEDLVLTLEDDENNPSISPIALFDNVVLEGNGELKLELADLESIDEAYEEGLFNYILTVAINDQVLDTNLDVEIFIETEEYQKIEDIIDFPEELYLKLLETVDKNGKSTFEILDHNLTIENKLEEEIALTLEADENNPSATPIALFNDQLLKGNGEWEAELASEKGLKEVKLEAGTFEYLLTVSREDEIRDTILMVEVSIETDEYQKIEDVVEYPEELYLELLETIDGNGYSTFEVTDHNLLFLNKLKQKIELSLEANSSNPSPLLTLSDGEELKNKEALELTLKESAALGEETIEEGLYEYLLTVSWKNEVREATLLIDVSIETEKIEKESTDIKEVLDFEEELFLELLETIDEDGNSTFEVVDHNLMFQNLVSEKVQLTLEAEENNAYSSPVVLLDNEELKNHQKLELELSHINELTEGTYTKGDFDYILTVSLKDETIEKILTIEVIINTEVLEEEKAPEEADENEEDNDQEDNQKPTEEPIRSEESDDEEAENTP